MGHEPARDECALLMRVKAKRGDTDFASPTGISAISSVTEAEDNEKVEEEDDDGLPGIWGEEDYEYEETVLVKEDGDTLLMYSSQLSFVITLFFIWILPVNGKLVSMFALGLLMLGASMLIFVPKSREIPASVAVPVLSALLGALAGGLTEQYIKQYLFSRWL